jgi:hypothetical protein
MLEKTEDTWKILRYIRNSCYVRTLGSLILRTRADTRMIRRFVASPVNVAEAAEGKQVDHWEYGTGNA